MGKEKEIIKETLKKALFLLGILASVVWSGINVFAADQPSDAPEIYLKEETEAVIAENDSCVYFSFTPVETAVYKFYSLGEYDTWGCLYDADMNLINSDDDGGRDSNFQISSELKAGTTYYFSARFYNNEETGSFYVYLTPYERTGIEGYVRDAEGEPLSGVEVRYGGDLAYTDETGFYQLEVEAGSEELIFSKDGYYELNYGYVLIEDGSVTEINVQMESRFPSDPPLLALDAPSEAVIAEGGKSAFFRFVPARDGSYRFWSEGNNDTCGTLYNEYKADITFNDDSGDDDRNFSIGYVLNAGETYYIETKIWGPTLTDSFPVYVSAAGIIEGYVRDSVTGGGLDRVAVRYGEYSAETDDEGYYLMFVPEGVNSLSFHKKGYSEAVYENVRSDFAQGTEQNALLELLLPADAPVLSLDHWAETEITDSEECAYYRFIPDRTGEYYFYLYADKGIILSLYDENGGFVTSAEDGDDYGCAFFQRELTAGTQYYALAECSNNDTGLVHICISDVNTCFIRGFVSDTSGIRLEGVTVTCGNASTITNADGFYIVLTTPGSRDLSFAKEGYIDVVRENVEAETGYTDRQNVVISAELGSDEYRAVLTWGDIPFDLDSHLTGPGYHVYYNNKTGIDAQLELPDDAPIQTESITFRAASTGTYAYYIHDYTNRNDPDCTQMAESGAQITVYKGNEQIALIRVPDSKGVYWEVFEIRDGEFRIINEIPELCELDSAMSYVTDGGTVYDGESHAQEICDSMRIFCSNSDIHGELPQSGSERQLVKDVHYSVSFINKRTDEDEPEVVNAGTYEVTVTGIGKHSGELTGYYEIAPKEIQEQYIDLSNYPDVLVTDDNGKELLEEVDFTVEETEIGETLKKVVIQGTGNYTSTVTMLHKVPGGNELILPQETKRVESEAFAGSDIEAVVIPYGCQSIGSRAFANCRKLEKVYVPQGFDGFGENVFDGCGSIEFIEW